MDLEAALHSARARVLADLTATDTADAAVVSMVEDAIAHRRWWVREWPEGAAFLAGLVAQDVQDALLDAPPQPALSARPWPEDTPGGSAGPNGPPVHGRWPLCPWHAAYGELHALLVEPELGPNPHWVCPADGTMLAPVGELGSVHRPDGCGNS